MEKSEDKKNFNNNYISILRKIIHKPIIVEFIFSYIQKRPFMLFDLIERDEFLKDQINSYFKKSKKNNYLSHSLNKNINTILFYKNLKELLKYGINNLNPYLFEDFFFENNMKPSFFNYTSQYILNQINQEKNNKNMKDLYNKNKSKFNNIYYEFMKQFKIIQLVYLPKINPKTKELYKDGLYIEENIINNNLLKQEIDVLYCIIDDNEYYNNIVSIRKNILINKIYFIFAQENNNKMFNGITKYLNKINITYIKEIIFGKKFLDNIFSIYENIFINNQKFFIPNIQKIILININNYNEDTLKLYLALSILFENSNKNNIYINGNQIFNSKYFRNENIENLEKVENVSQNSALIKIHNLTFLKNKSFMKIIKEYTDIKNITSISLYIYKEKNKINNSFTYNFEKYFFPLNNKNLLIYSEIPFIILTKNAVDIIEFKQNTLLLFRNKKDKNFIVYINEYIDENHYKLWGEYSNIEKFSFIYDYNSIIIYFDEKDLQSYLNRLNQIEYIKKEDAKYLDNNFNVNSDIKNKKKRKKKI